MKDNLIYLNEEWFNGYTYLEESDKSPQKIQNTKCNCRLEVSDMGYLECELEKDHIGHHQFTHNGETWPKRKYQISWERDSEKDFIFLEEYLKEINFEEVFVYIKENFNILSYNYKFEDDAIYGATPLLWLNVEYNQDFEEDDAFYEIIWAEESKINAYLHDNLLFRGKQIHRDTLSIHLSIYPKNEGEHNE